MSSDTPDSTMWVYTVNLAASSLSLFGSLAIIINYIFFTRVKQQILYKLIFFLCLADFGGSLSIWISQLLLIVNPDHYDITMCKVFRAAINFFFVSSFCWTSSISVHMFACSRQKAQIPHVWFHIVSWGIPTVTTTVLLAGDMITVVPESGWCHPKSLARWALWFAPLIATFIWNAVLYLLILFRYSQPQVASLSYMNEAQRKFQWKIKRRLSLYLLAFALCWVWDVADNIIGQFDSDFHPYWLFLLQSFFSPLQGFLNFLVYGISSRMFRHPTNPNEKQRLLTSVQ